MHGFNEIALQANLSTVATRRETLDDVTEDVEMYSWPKVRACNAILKLILVSMA